jgi:hypothetical protein
MRDSGKVILAILFMAMLCLPVVQSNSDAQPITNSVVIKTDYELLGVSDLHGGGHLTFELSGRAAGDLRRAVLASYDGMYSPYVTNNRIDTSELRIDNQRGYIARVEAALQFTQFFAASSNSFNPLHHGQGEDITVDAQGFAEVTNIANDDTTPISIYLYFDATGSGLPYSGFSLNTRDFINALYGQGASDALSQNSYNTYIQPYIDQYTFKYSHTDFRICVGAMYNPSIRTGSLHVIRTPAGEISTYNVGYTYLDYPTSDRATYNSFNFFESPLVLFIIVFICAYLLASMPTRQYANYKYAFPRRYRHKALKITWLHITSKVMILLLLLFYFFPTMFAFIAPSLFISGLILWILSIILAVLFSVVAKLLYDQKIANIPKDYLAPPVRRVPRVRSRPVPVTRTTTPAGVNVTVHQGETKQAPRAVPAATPAAAPVAQPVTVKETGPPCVVCRKPIADYSDLTKCKCGQLYHEKCANVAENCTTCGTTLIEEAEPEVKMTSIQCPTCGEINSVPEGSDLISENCKACGVMLERIDQGYNYLVVDNDPKMAFEMFVSVLKQGGKGLTISTTFPDKIKKEHEIAQSEVIWLTDTSVPDQKTINPHRLEFEMMRMYASFVKGNDNAVIILDGFEYLVVENGFDKVFKFIKKVNDLSSMNKATLFVPIGVSSLEPDQLGTLKKEFDKVVVLTDDEI